MPDGITVLGYAVRPRAVALYLGQLALMLAALSFVPLAASLALGQYAYSTRLAIVVFGLLLVALPGLRIRPPERIQVNEALVVIALAFIASPVLMSYPLASGNLPFVDVLFESVSAITTTGLSTAGSIEHRAPMFLFLRSWMQWYGGLGIAVLSVALLMGHQAAARRLAEPVENENIATTARTQSRQLLRVYVALTGLGIALLWLTTGDAFTAVTHMLATLSTGGFSTFDASLAALPRSAAWVVTLFALLGAVPLLLLFHAAAGRPGELLRDAEVRALVACVVLLTCLLGISLHASTGSAWSDAFADAALLGVSAQTTTGFAALDVASLDPTSKLLLILGMLVGGASGSTAGGIKLLRLLVFLRLLQYFLRRTTLPPHAVIEPRLGGRALQAADVERATLILGLFAGVLGLSWLAFVAHGHDALDALFEVTSALSTVGLSTGISAPDLAPLLKLLLCVDMLLGRLEILALLVLLYPRTWIGRRAS